MQEQMLITLVANKTDFVTELTRTETAENVRSTFVIADAALDGLTITSTDYANQTTDLDLRAGKLYMFDSVNDELVEVDNSTAQLVAAKSYTDTKIAELNQGRYNLGVVGSIDEATADAAVALLPASQRPTGKIFVYTLLNNAIVDSVAGTVPYGGEYLGVVQGDGSVTWTTNADDRVPLTNILDVANGTDALTGQALATIDANLSTAISNIATLTTITGDHTTSLAILNDAIKFNDFQRYFLTEYTDDEVTFTPTSNSALTEVGGTNLQVDLTGSGITDGTYVLRLVTTNGWSFVVEATVASELATFTNSGNEYRYVSSLTVGSAQLMRRIEDAFDADLYYTKTEADAITDVIATDVTNVTNDLATNYYTKTQIDTTVTGLQDSITAVADDLAANYYTKTEADAITNAIDTKVDAFVLYQMNQARLTLGNTYVDSTTEYSSVGAIFGTSGSDLTVDLTGSDIADGTGVYAIGTSKSRILVSGTVASEVLTFSNATGEYTHVASEDGISGVFELKSIATALSDSVTDAVSQSQTYTDVNSTPFGNVIRYTVTNGVSYNGNVLKTLKDSLSGTMNTTPVSDVSNGSTTLSSNGDFTFTASSVGTDAMVVEVTVDAKTFNVNVEFDVLAKTENASPRVIVTLVAGSNYNTTTGVITIPVSISTLTARPVVKRRSTDLDPDYEFDGGLRSWNIVGGNLVITTNPAHDYSNYRIVYKGN